MDGLVGRSRTRILGGDPVGSPAQTRPRLLRGWPALPEAGGFAGRSRRVTEAPLGRRFAKARKRESLLCNYLPCPGRWSSSKYQELLGFCRKPCRRGSSAEPDVRLIL